MRVNPRVRKIIPGPREGAGFFATDLCARGHERDIRERGVKEASRAAMKPDVVRKVVVWVGSALVGCSPTVYTVEAEDGRDRTSADAGFPRFDVPPGPARPPSLQGLPVADFGPVVTASRHVPALSGGTLTVLRDGTTAVASDPDGDALWVVDLANEQVRARVALRAGDEPGRVVEGSDHRVHVALRHGGAVASVDARTGVLVERRALCPAPRGVAWDASRAELLVACAGGELVRAPEAGTQNVRVRKYDPDLRDVAVTPQGVYVSWFRRAAVARVRDDGELVWMGAPTVVAPGRSAGVAWRMVAGPSGGVWLLHQTMSERPLGSGTSGGYGGAGPLDPPVDTSITFLQATTEAALWMQTRRMLDVHLGIDFAISPDASTRAVVAPGGAELPLSVIPGSSVDLVTTVGDRTSRSYMVARRSDLGGSAQSIAVAFDGRGRLIVQTRSPARLAFPQLGRFIALDATTYEDTGHRIFHATTASSFACASCHPEGGDDGRTWNIAGFGPRRTPSLRGGITDTAPFHWAGDMRDFAHLATEVFGQRMGGGALNPSHTRAIERWVGGIPAIATGAPEDVAAAARGAALFNDPGVGCAGCHSGAHFTNNQSVDVGTGGAFQVPPLTGLRFRAPYLHHGVAPTLRERFTRSEGGGDLHGHTSHLTPAALDDLVAYLDTL